MKNLFYPLLFATALVSAACTNDLENDGSATDSSNKTAISFIGEDNTNITRAGFKGDTQIAMHIRSTMDDENIRETCTLANADDDKVQKEETYSNIQAPSKGNERYWDDAFGRKAQLSVFAAAVPGKKDIKNNNSALIDLMGGTSNWTSGKRSEEIAWQVSLEQTNESIANEDLTFSNNISKNGVGGAKAYDYSTKKYTDTKDGYLLFRLKDNGLSEGPGKFDQGHLKFNHAMSRVTINLKKGTGYGDGSFNFALDKEGNPTSVTFLNAPISGNLDIEAGEWKDVTTDTIFKMAHAENVATGAKYSLMSQMLPGFVIKKGDNNNVLEFVIDENKYYITHDMMFGALYGHDSISSDAKTENTITMEMGHNYVFNITVGKSQIINVTATLEPWTYVTAKDQTMDNSHITLELYKNGSGSACENFDLYRLNDESSDISTEASKAKNWGGNYTTENKATLTYNTTEKKWETNWFFENNKAFYHFRTVDKDIKIEENNSDKDDYFVITSGAQDDDHNHWGAPFIKSTTSPIKYSTTDGYAEFLSPAIGATNSTINLTELHMMSNINVILRTTKDTSSDHVALVTTETTSTGTTTKQCEVSLTYFYARGQVKMGNGLVTPFTEDGLKESATFTAPKDKGTKADGNTDYVKTNAFTFAVVPQALVRTIGDQDHLYVGITIKTPDNNQYYVVEKLSEIIASANGGSQNQTANDKIDFWFPNHSYTYTFTLTKAGIKNVTCSVENWIYVTATNKDITLED